MKAEGEGIKRFHLVDKTQHSVSSLTGYAIRDFSFKIRDFLDTQTCLTTFSYLALSGKSLTGLPLELTVGQCFDSSPKEGIGGRVSMQISL